MKCEFEVGKTVKSIRSSGPQRTDGFSTHSSTSSAFTFAYKRSSTYTVPFHILFFGGGGLLSHPQRHIE